jgi:hypothetical protein
MRDDPSAGGLQVTIESRTLKRSLGPTAWAVLEDVVLDAVPRDGHWIARTSTRRVADHLGLTPGTVARALARLCTDGIVHREDRRDVGTGRFAESVYIVAALPCLRPCVDSPHTEPRDTESPDPARPDTEAPPTDSRRKEHRHVERRVADPGSNTSGRRRAPMQQLLLLGEDPSATTSAPFNPATPSPPEALHPRPQTPTTPHPALRPLGSDPPNPTTQRPSDSCQPSGQSFPGASAFRPETGA